MSNSLAVCFSSITALFSSWDILEKKKKHTNLWSQHLGVRGRRNRGSRPVLSIQWVWGYPGLREALSVKEIDIRSWRVSAIKSTGCCSFQRTWFQNDQHSHDSSRLSVTSVLGELTPSSGLLGTRYTGSICTYMQTNTNMHKIKILS